MRKNLSQIVPIVGFAAVIFTLCILAIVGISSLIAIFGMSGWAVVGFIVVYFSLNPEKIDKWIAIITRLFAWLGYRIESTYIARDVQSRVNEFVNQLETEVDGITPYQLKIEWVKAEEVSEEAFIRGNEVVVVMNCHKNQDKNFVKAVMAYLSKGIIPKARGHVDKKVVRSVDLFMGQKIIGQRNIGSALDYFLEEEFEPIIKKDEKIKEYVSKMSDLDEQGVFHRILLREFLYVGRKMYGELPKSEVKRETSEFLKFLWNIIAKEGRKDVPLIFLGEKIRVDIVLMALPSKVMFHGIKPYTKAVEKCIDAGCDRVYLLARGINVENAKAVAKYFKKSNRIEKLREDVYAFYSVDKRKNIKTICMVLAKRKIEGA